MISGGWAGIVALAAAFAIAVLTTPAGVSGAVLLLPFQVSVLGTPNPSVTPTNLLYNVIAAPGAIFRYRRQGQTGGALTAILLAGTLPGVIAGSVIRVYLLPGINSATLVADAKHSWLDALSSAGALAGLVAVAFGETWGDPVAGLAVTLFICHVGYEVTKDVVHRLADGVDPDVITRAEAAAGSVPGVIHAHARARWTGRTLRIEIEGWVNPDLTAKDADAMGRLVADQLSGQLPETGSFTWATRAAPT
ncbi:MAG: cation transporter [Streptosporangiaceae bacterium]